MAENTAPAPMQGALIHFHHATEQERGELSELAEITNTIAAAWREHVPAAPFLPMPHHPIVGLILAMRRVKRGEAPGLKTAGGDDFQRYIAAVRTVAELAPALHARLAADLADAKPHAVRVFIEAQVAETMATLLDHLAEAAALAARGARVCEAVTRRRDMRGNWHIPARFMGELVTRQLRKNAEIVGMPPPALSLRNPESTATKLCLDLLSAGGISASRDAFAALHKINAES